MKREKLRQEQMVLFKRHKSKYLSLKYISVHCFIFVNLRNTKPLDPKEKQNFLTNVYKEFGVRYASGIFTLCRARILKQGEYINSIQ